MSGISQYFHSEEANATAVTWIPSDDTLFYALTLSGDPHRDRAYDYGSDIGIDPLIQPGDRVVYLRADNWSGIWVRTTELYYPEFDRAFDRVMANRKWMEDYRELIERPSPELERFLGRLADETGVTVRTAQAGEDFSERTSTPPTVFLSYSSRNVMIARDVFERLRFEGGMDVWFDHDQGGESDAHDSQIAAWLERSVQEAQLFVLLLTRTAVQSDWVRKEIAWGEEKAARDPGFHFVLLKLDDAPLPAPGQGRRVVVDCSGMSRGEFLEDLYAAVYKRQTRREWLEEQRVRGWPAYEPPARGYDHLASDAGKAVALRWLRQDGKVRWQLDYEIDGEIMTVHGGGEKEIVDPGIQPGDKIGFFRLGSEATPIWMRSKDLSLSPIEVRRDYLQELEVPSIDRPGKFLPLRTCLANTFALFVVLAPGLLVGKFTFARDVPWWLIVLAWIGVLGTTSLHESIVFRQFEGPGAGWWGTPLGALTTLLMLCAGLVAGILFLVRAGGGLDISWKVLVAGYLASLFIVYVVGYVSQIALWKRRRKQLIARAGGEGVPR